VTDVFLAHPEAPEELKLLFLDACARPTSIHQHLTVLRDTASGLKHITELGVGEGWSTFAWLLVQPERLVLVDHGWQAVLPTLERVRGRTKIVFVESDDLMIRIEPTDLLFIDTEHHYAHLKEELRLHADRVSKYILLHDTTTFGDVGEQPHLVGVWPAIEEFLAAHPEWELFWRHTHNNGLTCLRRVG
jgi:hypothetical protein